MPIGQGLINQHYGPPAGGAPGYNNPKAGQPIGWLEQYNQGKKLPPNSVGTPTGTGAEFLGSLSWGGANVLDPSRGDPNAVYDRFDYRGPNLQAAFLAGEMGPGGFLSPGQQSLETARGVRGIFEQGNETYDRTLNALGSSGLSSRYARPIAQQARAETGNEAMDFLRESMGEGNQRRFSAMLEYVNMASQTQIASIRDRTNYELAKKAAKKTGEAALIGGAAMIGGAALGNPAMFGAGASKYSQG